MKAVRQMIGGLGNLLFKEAFIYGMFRQGGIQDIYLQSHIYWKDFKDEVRNRFMEGITPGSVDKVSLHLRRGDYVGHPFYVDLSQTDYYQRAVKLFPDDEFLVFCKDNQNKNVDQRDRGWALDFMRKLGVPFTMAPESNTEVEDLNLMASCKAHILANSSFSWWAAFLGGGRSIAPSKWFTDGINRIDLLPEWEIL